ncbi:sister chromatid cohesion protein Dcc1 [Pilobolus umbonatus]|nr:sister chromatid cohesion protein Dcc1 [Pilobolus umbonatus]
MPEQDLLYCSSFKKDTYKFVELSSPELVEAFATGNHLVIKGLPEDEAVLCTESRTYAVHKEASSNTFLLMESDTYKVVDNLSDIIQLTPCLARLHRIDDVLAPTAYAGYKNEEQLQDKTFYTYHDLMSVVQASEMELSKGLKVRGAFEYKGYYRVFDKSYLLGLLDALLTSTAGMNLTGLTTKEAIQHIQTELSFVDEEAITPDEITLAGLRCFISDEDELSEDGTVPFNERKICRFLGEYLLSQTKNKRWEIDDFMEVWKGLGQNLFTPELEDISGLCVYHELTKLQQTVQYIQYFPVYELSTDPSQRFATLFAEKPLWGSEEITPFLIDLAPNQKERDKLLLKYTRTRKTKDSILYGSRVK